MKLYTLSSYSDQLNDTYTSADYQDVYMRMQRSYHLARNGMIQSTEEIENTRLDDFHALAVIHGDWIEWNITEQELALPFELEVQSNIHTDSIIIHSSDADDAYAKLLASYYGNHQELCFGEFMSTVEVHGLPLETVMELTARLYKDIEGDYFLRIEGDYHEI